MDKAIKNISAMLDEQLPDTDGMPASPTPTFPAGEPATPQIGVNRKIYKTLKTT